ncbi:MAG: hypothetical protein FWF92_02875 [Oscillospiraceae bacterium]|nr:hypothetical protein [Oscillospiraceae bacterium]
MNSKLDFKEMLEQQIESDSFKAMEKSAIYFNALINEVCYFFKIMGEETHEIAKHEGEFRYGKNLSETVVENKLFSMTCDLFGITYISAEIENAEYDEKCYVFTIPYSFLENVISDELQERKLLR